MNETLLMVLTAISLTSSAIIWILAWKMNQDWARFARELLDENEKMSNGWHDFYQKIMEVPRDGK